MSLGYAEKLSYKSDVGAVGQKEHLDSADDVERKSAELASLVRHLEDNTSAGQHQRSAERWLAPVPCLLHQLLCPPASSRCCPALHCRVALPCVVFLHGWLHKWQQLVVRGQVCVWHANEMRAGATHTHLLFCRWRALHESW